MILLWGLPGDSALAQVRGALARRASGTSFIDQRAVLSTTVEFTVPSDLTGTIRTPDATIALEDVTAVYLRPYCSVDLPHVKRAGFGSPAWHHAQCIDDALISWCELTPALVVNRASAMASNSSKPYQAGFIEAAGFDVPETLITTDAAAVMAFWERHGTVIYKSISGVRSIVSRLTPTRSRDLYKVRWCPTQFQQYVPGTDYRVHVVGDELFACQVLSTADDYRYDSETVERRPCELPSEVAQRCRALAVSLGLAVAGIDLRLDPDGRWYCFEANPSPAFTYYQHATGQPIDDAVAALLANFTSLSALS